MNQLSEDSDMQHLGYDRKIRNSQENLPVEFDACISRQKLPVQPVCDGVCWSVQWAAHDRGRLADF